MGSRTRRWTDRGLLNLSFRLCVPFDAFYATVDNETSLDGKGSLTACKIKVDGVEQFLGFGLLAFSDKNRL